MKLTEALKTVHDAELLDAPSFQVVLACGFTPLYFETFLAAHLQSSLPQRHVKIVSGLYGDLAGTLERSLPPETEAIAIALEWPDLDRRLGYRGLGGWGPTQESEILGSVETALRRLADAIGRLGLPVAISLPSLPLPPLFHTSGSEAGKTELEIQSALANFAVCLTKRDNIAVANSQRLLEESPHHQRFNLKSELLTGHPYSVLHADALAASLSRLLKPPTPKKGLITDLDDTLWSGLVGEVGPEGVAWDLDSGAQIHGLYQQTLAALAGQGVLLAVASKNNTEDVERAFARRDILVTKGAIFPLEVHWRPKSESIGRILASWNIGADSVVFVDDNPMELGEVKASWPDIECILFTKNDHAAALATLRRLRDLFGKRQLVEEDGFRLASLRTAAQTSIEPQAQNYETFLSEADGILTAQFNPASWDPRVIELVNKTNQFNLNGVRRTETEWRRSLDLLNWFVLVVSYADKYGPLGKIAVLAGRRDERALHVETWVMSCRAFSRRIEHGCISLLFAKCGVRDLHFEFVSTPKNNLVREFLLPFAGSVSNGLVTITIDQFEAKRPNLYYKIETP